MVKLQRKHRHFMPLHLLRMLTLNGNKDICLILSQFNTEKTIKNEPMDVIRCMVQEA